MNFPKDDKQQIRERCLALVDQIRAVNSVPDRVMRGPLQAATTWKRVYRDATQCRFVRQREISARHTRSDLLVIEQRLQDYLAQLT